MVKRVLIVLGIIVLLIIALIMPSPFRHGPDTVIVPHYRDTSITSHDDSEVFGIAQASHPVTATPSTRSITRPEPVDATPSSAKLIIPVQSIPAHALRDTYTQARSNGRVHDAIDIMAPHNTPVIAAASGTILRLFQSKLGGTTIYELSADSSLVYYYAHLDHYAVNLKNGDRIEQGQTIGYVGDTGDAGPGNYHLHFAIWKIQDRRNFWNGENINPYPILMHNK